MEPEQMSISQTEALPNSRMLFLVFVRVISCGFAVPGFQNAEDSDPFTPAGYFSFCDTLGADGK